MTDDPTPEATTPEAGVAEFIVVFRGISSARFLPEEGCEFLIDAPGLELENVRVRTFTRWVAEGTNTLPRELVVEVRGRAESLDDAILKFGAIARPIATMAAFVANVRVGSIEVHLAYDCTPSRKERQFLETLLPDERGEVPEGRIIRQRLMNEACKAFIGLGADYDRVYRALRQYELALREWHLGGEWLALAHLWVAAENLTKSVIRKTMTDQWIPEEELAKSLGLVTDDPDRPRWRELLGARARQALVFAGDNARTQQPRMLRMESSTAF